MKTPDKGLVIKSPWVDKILDGDKTWEIRGANINIRGQIALIKSGTGLILGTAEVVDCIGPLDRETIENTIGKHNIPQEMIDKDWPFYAKTYAWVLKNPVRFDPPIAYKHPTGAVIWVNLGDKKPQRRLAP